jgi:EmrB/QacA subfamily drug resistance transporter
MAIYAGLMTAVLIASLDQTIVATALPHIVTDLGGLSSYSWVFTAFLLCQAISVPIYGKLGDIYGRRRLLLAAVAIFVASSALCGAAQSMNELIVFRALQGIGAGGLIPLAQATVGEIVPARDRGRYQSLISGAFATSAVMGPAVGGLIVDNTTWRWIFYVNLPIGGLAFLVIALTMPQRLSRRAHSIDYLGALLLAGGTGAFLLALVWGGVSYPWLSGEITGALALAAVFVVGFVVVERRVREPILPFALLRDPTVTTGAVAMCLAGMCMFGTIAFVPLFAQKVLGSSATSSGIVLTPFMLGGVSASIISGYWVARTGRYRMSALLGPLFLGVGMFLLWRMDLGTTSVEVARNMVLGGLGMGLMMNVLVLAAQNSVATSVLGTTTALLQFSRALGTTAGVTLFGVVVDHGLSPALRTQGTVAGRLSLADRERISEALHPAFLMATCVSAAIFVVVFVGLKEHSLRGAIDDVPFHGGVMGDD